MMYIFLITFIFELIRILVTIGLWSESSVSIAFISFISVDEKKKSSVLLMIVSFSFGF